MPTGISDDNPPSSVSLVEVTKSPCTLGLYDMFQRGLALFPSSTEEAPCVSTTRFFNLLSGTEEPSLRMPHFVRHLYESSTVSAYSVLGRKSLYLE